MLKTCNYEKFEKILSAKNCRPVDVCKATGFPSSLFSEWKKGKSRPKIDKLRRIAEFLGVEVEELQEEVGLTPEEERLRDRAIQKHIEMFMQQERASAKVYSPTLLPILGTVSAGLPMYAQQNILGYMSVDVPKDEAEYFCLKVKGDSMSAARIADGDTVVVRRQSQVENGDIALVMVGDEEATIKRFFLTNGVVQLIPQSYNPVYQTRLYDPKIEQITVLGKVIKNVIEFGGSL